MFATLKQYKDSSESIKFFFFPFQNTWQYLVISLPSMIQNSVLIWMELASFQTYVQANLILCVLCIIKAKLTLVMLL